MSFGVEVLKDVDSRWLDPMLLRDGLTQPVKYKKLRNVPRNDLLVWCHDNGIYQIPTVELIEWLRLVIDGRSAIEICAGRSCLGRALGIPMTDAYLCEQPDVLQAYRSTRQTPIEPSPDVEKLTANEAVLKYKPQVVIGAWVTQKWKGVDVASNMYGPDEETILDTGAIYIHIGNITVHGDKRIMQRPHLEYQYPWLMSRGFDRSKNRIWVWNARERQ